MVAVRGLLQQENLHMQPNKYHAASQNEEPLGDPQCSVALCTGGLGLLFQMQMALSMA